jgi:hypothetical protein
MSYQIKKVKAPGSPRLFLFLNPDVINPQVFENFELILKEMSEWCKKNECGHRSSYNQF